MSKNEINNALSKGRSQNVGQAIDDSIILELLEIDLVNTGEISPLTTIIQKLSIDAEAIVSIDLNHEKIKSLHIPPQITTIEDNAFEGTINCEKVDLKNIENAKNYSFAGLAIEREQPIEVHLNNIIRVGEGAFGDAKAIIHLNENVQDVDREAFIRVPELHYKGNLTGAPWGAKEWIKD